MGGRRECEAICTTTPSLGSSRSFKAPAPPGVGTPLAELSRSVMPSSSTSYQDTRTAVIWPHPQHGKHAQQPSQQQQEACLLTVLFTLDREPSSATSPVETLLNTVSAARLIKPGIMSLGLPSEAITWAERPDGCLQLCCPDSRCAHTLNSHGSAHLARRLFACQYGHGTLASNDRGD